MLFSYDTNETTGSLAVFHGRSRSFTVAEIDFESIPVTLSLIVFEGRYWSFQKFHSVSI